MYGSQSVRRLAPKLKMYGAPDLAFWLETGSSIRHSTHDLMDVISTPLNWEKNAREPPWNA